MLNEEIRSDPAISGSMQNHVHKIPACSPLLQCNPHSAACSILPCGGCRALPRAPAGQDLPRAGLVSKSLLVAALAAPQALAAPLVPAQAQALLLGLARVWGPPAAAVGWAWPAHVRSTEHVACQEVATRAEVCRGGRLPRGRPSKHPAILVWRGQEAFFANPTFSNTGERACKQQTS